MNPLPHIFISFLVGFFKIFSHRKFQLYNTVLSTIVIMFCINSLLLYGFQGWRTQYYKDVGSPQSNLWTQCNPNQKSQQVFFLLELDKMTLKCIEKCKRPRVSWILLKNKAERLAPPGPKTY